MAVDHDNGRGDGREGGGVNEQRRRYMVFRSAKAREFLCICKARNEQHALEIAGRMFRLERTAWAIAE
jgi:hypothetical protein